MGILETKLKELAEMLESRSLNMCYVQESRFRGKSTWMLKWKITQNKSFCIRKKIGLGLAILLAKKIIKLLT